MSGAFRFIEYPRVPLRSLDCARRRLCKWHSVKARRGPDCGSHRYGRVFNGVGMTTGGMFSPVREYLTGYKVDIFGVQKPAIGDLFGGGPKAKWDTIAVFCVILLVFVLKGKPSFNKLGKRGVLTHVEAAEIVSLSEGHIKRRREEGTGGIVHRSKAGNPT